MLDSGLSLNVSHIHWSPFYLCHCLQARATASEQVIKISNIFDVRARYERISNASLSKSSYRKIVTAPFLSPFLSR